jgi:hypothetical protein
MPTTQEQRKRECPHGRLQVGYTVCVDATVEDGAVVRVQEFPDTIQLRAGGDVMCADCWTPITDKKVIAAAVAVAEGNDPWPTWG